jgi:hypothetical protein
MFTMTSGVPADCVAALELGAGGVVVRGATVLVWVKVVVVGVVGTVLAGVKVVLVGVMATVLAGL